MCLRRVSRKRPPRGKVVAYKVMRRVDGGYASSVRRDREKPYRVGTWYRASGTNIARGRIRYPAGFHAWRTLRGANGWLRPDLVRVRVLLKGVHTSGRQYGAAAVVAKYMRILEEVK